MMDYGEKLQRCHGYLNSLEEERRKIEMFQRELPLCLELVTRAIEACKEQISGTTGADPVAAATATECLNGQSECSEQTTSDGPVFEEFMPIKSCYSSEQAKEEDDNGEFESHNNSTKFNSNDDKSCSGKKSDWLRSVQLWNQAPDPPNTNEEHQINKPIVELKRNGGAFHPFKKEKTAQVGPTPSSPATTVCSTAEAAAAGKEGEGQPRKCRRCWSPELHRRFLNALQQLGGSHVATPKQIKELMKVDGLTNDEVKSHLQKYRLHTRRPAPAVHNNANTQAPQFVVVGGIWVPPADYALTSSQPAVLPCHQAISTLVQREQQKLSLSHSQGADGARCNSSSTSSSTHTTTASKA